MRASFSRCSNAVRNELFRSLCTPMYPSQIWWNFRKSCMQRLRVAYNFGCRALYNVPWRASVSSHDSSGWHLKALVFLYAFEESVDCHLLSSFCDDSNLHITLFKYVLSTMGVSKESISKFLIGNRFYVKLRILSPENCKQSLRVKSWKAEVTAEKKQTQDYNQNFVTQAHKS